MTTHFGWLDAAILLVYLAVLSATGFYFSRRQQNLEAFFLAGRGVAWLPVGLSLMACLNSGIDYIMQPSTTIKYGLVFLVGTTSWIFLYPWTTKITVPFYRRMKVFSAYEYLEKRFDVRVRTLAAGIFVLWRLGWISTAMYVPCLAVNTATGGKVPITPMIILLGGVVTLYTMLGGMKAVIWTDVIQFFVMFGGLGATIVVVVANVPGGAAAIWSTAEAGGRTTLIAPLAGFHDASLLTKAWLFFTQPYNALGLFTAFLVGRLAVFTCDQVMVQRFQTSRSVKDSRRAFLINAFGDTIWMVGLSIVGLALFTYFQAYPHPQGLQSDDLFPYFMAQKFVSGVIGLVIAAIFAASLGAMGSAINSCTSVVVVDFYNNLILRSATGPGRGDRAEDGEQVLISRVSTVVLGVIAITLSCFVGGIGDLIDIAMKVIQLFPGVLFAIYLLGMFTERAHGGAVLTGGLVGMVTAAYVAFASPLSPVWPGPAGFATTLLIGSLLTMLTPRDVAESARELTWRRVMRLADPDVATCSVNKELQQLAAT
jgi:SSS family transporter